MNGCIAVAIGGASGALLRYGVYYVIHDIYGASLPWGTFAVNCIGSLIIGTALGLFEIFSPSHELCLFTVVGFLGSFTTFSALSAENVEFFRNGQYYYALSYSGLSIMCGLLMVLAGFRIASLVSQTMS